MTVQTKTIDYTDGDAALEGYFAWDDAVSGPRPGVLIVHAWAGRSPFEEKVARKLAGLGYAGMAMDVYGKGVLGGDAYTGEGAKGLFDILVDTPFARVVLREL